MSHTTDSEATVVRSPQRATPDDDDATVVVQRRQAPIQAAPASSPWRTLTRTATATATATGTAQPTGPLTKTLAQGFALHEYRIDRVLGQGGFGITYLATDVHLNAKVAIKEFLPEEIARRDAQGQVGAKTELHDQRYHQGLESFLAEARTLASFRHPAIVRVARFFEAHNTAYMVLEYEQGTPFRTWWPANSARGEAGLIELLLPLLEGLGTVHAAGFLHRDIKPDNIQVRQADGGLVLLDFGSAGQTVAVGGQDAVVVTPGYAPIEQYGHGDQGPWTDLYALAATLYWAVTGHKPPDAETRALQPAAMTSAVQAGRGRFGDAFLRAIDQALDTDGQRRPRNVAEFRQALCVDHVSSLNLQEALMRGDLLENAAADRHAEPCTLGPNSSGARLLAEQLAALPKSGQPPGWLRRLAAPFAQLKALLWRRPQDWPLAVKMMGAMLATALLPMTMIGAYNLAGSVQAVNQGELQNVRQMAHSTAGRLGQFVQDARHTAAVSAGDRNFLAFLQQPNEADKAALRDTIRDTLSRMVKADPDVQLVMLMDREGNAVVASDPKVMGRNFRFRDYFQQAIQGKPHTTGLVVGAVAGASGLFLAEPVRDEAGQVLGVLALRILGTSVAGILSEVQQVSTLTPMLIDGDGVVVHHPQADLLYASLAPLPADALARIKADQRFRRDTVKSLNETDLARAMVGAKTTGHVSWFSKVAGVEQIAGYAPVPGQDWVVGMVESRASFEAPLQRLYSHMLWSVGLVGLLFTGLALMFARSIVRPVRALTNAALALKAGDHEAARVKVESRDEVGQLARTFNIMIDVLRQRERDSRRARLADGTGSAGSTSGTGNTGNTGSATLTSSTASVDGTASLPGAPGAGITNSPAAR